MKTEDRGYSEYLENKYLPGRSLYLRWIFYPKMLRRLDPNHPIIDLGCGTGEFLRFCRQRGRAVIGVDSNPTLAAICRQDGFEVLLDSVCELGSLRGRTFRNAVCDNVLEHLDRDQLRQFFRRLEELLAPGGLLMCIVPGAKGFEKDPTHKTYVTHEVLREVMNPKAFAVAPRYFHPINVGLVDRVCYLNMQVFEIRKDETY